MKKLLPFIFLFACAGDDIPSQASVPIPEEIQVCDTEEFAYELNPIDVDSGLVRFIQKTVSKTHTEDVSHLDFEQIYVESAILHGNPELNFIEWIRVFLGDEMVLWSGLPSDAEEEMGVDGSINIVEYFEDDKLTLKGVSRASAPSKDTDVWMVINLVTVDTCPDQPVTKSVDIERKNSP